MRESYVADLEKMGSEIGIALFKRGNALKMGCEIWISFMILLRDGVAGMFSITETVTI